MATNMTPAQAWEQYVRRFCRPSDPQADPVEFVRYARVVGEIESVDDICIDWLNHLNREAASWGRPGIEDVPGIAALLAQHIRDTIPGVDDPNHPATHERRPAGPDDEVE